MAQAVKNLPAMQETQQARVQSLGRENPLEEEMATLVFLPGKSHGQRSLVGYSPQGCKESDMTQHSCSRLKLTNRPLSQGLERV